LIPGLLVLGLGRAGHDLVAPLLDGGQQALVLRFCDLPDDDVEIGFSHYGSLLALHAIPHGAANHWRVLLEGWTPLCRRGAVISSADSRDRTPRAVRATR
jgi:hypothetical protein